jgi:predicted RNase H-like HicB family nuclease
MVMKIEMVVERTKTGYSAYAAKYPVYTIGKSLDELKVNMLEAVNLYLEKQGKTLTEKDLEITLDLPQFFEFYKVINAKALSERISMNQSLLAQYIKGNKKPSRAQTLRILKGVQQIGSELAAIRFLL